MLVYTGYSVVQRNVTRLCDVYAPAGCNEQCLVQLVESILAAQSAGSSSSQLVSTVVPAVVVPVGKSHVVTCVFGCLRKSSRRLQHACFVGAAAQAAPRAAPAVKFALCCWPVVSQCFTCTCVLLLLSRDLCAFLCLAIASLSACLPACLLARAAVLASTAALAAWLLRRKRKRRAARETALREQQEQEKQALRLLEEGDSRGMAGGGGGGGDGAGGAARGLRGGGQRGNNNNSNSNRLYDLAPHGPGVPVGLIGRALNV